MYQIFRHVSAAFLICSFLPIAGFGQSLFSNGDFENYTTCPMSLGQLDNVLGLSSCTVTPDYYNCSFLPDNSCSPGVTAPSGTGFIGMFGGTWNSTSTQYESFIVTLDQPTTIGTQYELSFLMNTINKPYAPCYAGGARDCMDFAFRFFKSSTGISCPTGPFMAANTHPVPHASINCSNIISGSWNKYTLQFTADDVYDRLLVYFCPTANAFTSPCYDAWPDPISKLFMDQLCIVKPGDPCTVCTNYVDAGSDLSGCSADTVKLGGLSGGGVSSVLWSSTGDGQFGNPSALKTSYLPGQNDRNQGQVMLKLNEMQGTSGCPPAADSLQITFLTDSVPDILSPGLVCHTDSLYQLQANIAGGWWTGTGIIDTVQGIFSPLNAGIGTSLVSYEIQAACGGTDTMFITVLAQDNPDFSYPSASYCLPDEDPLPIIQGLAGGTFSMDQNGIIDPASGRIDLSSLQGGQYTVHYATHGACPDKELFQITMCEEQELIIPNVFSPDGDGLNDVFTLTTTSIRTIKGSILNRWGNEMVRIDAVIGADQIFINLWDGTLKGEQVNTGVYFYTFEFEDKNGNLSKQQGYIHLVR